MNFLYILGPPGIGKTSLLAELTKDLLWRERLYPFAHTLYWEGPSQPPILVELGARHGTPFAGTDGLALNVMPLAERWVRLRPYENMVAEGDRLASERFFVAVAAAGYHLTVIALSAPPEALEARRAARAEALTRRKQNPTWIKGRETKVRNLIGEWSGTFKLDATRPLAELAEQVRDRYPPLRRPEVDRVQGSQPDHGARTPGEGGEDPDR